MNKDYFYSDDFNRLCNWALAFLFGLFFIQNIKVALDAGFKLSIVLLVIFNALVVFLLLTRRKPKDVSFELQDIVATFLGTFAMMMARGVVHTEDIFLLQIIGMIGIIISIAGLATLRKSFGLLPADRGIVTKGIYQFIRHPIYCGYLINYTCFLIQNYSLYNLIVFIVFAIFEAYRLTREEKLLKHNPQYLEYTKQVKWRVLPKIW